MKNFKTDTFLVVKHEKLREALKNDRLSDFYKIIARLENTPNLFWGVVKEGRLSVEATQRSRRLASLNSHQPLKLEEGDDLMDLKFINNDTSSVHPVTIRFLCAGPNSELLKPIADILHPKQKHNLFRPFLEQREPVSCITKLLSLDESCVLEPNFNTPDGNNTMVKMIKLSPKCLPVIAEMIMLDLFLRDTDQLELIKKEMLAIGFIGSVISESAWDKGMDAYKKISAPYIDIREGYVDQSRHEMLEKELTKDITWMTFFKILLKHIFQRVIETVTFSKYEENEYNTYNRREAFKYLYHLIKDTINERNIAKENETELDYIEAKDRVTVFNREGGLFKPVYPDSPMTPPESVGDTSHSTRIRIEQILAACGHGQSPD
jgi:hypothetical protein